MGENIVYIRINIRNPVCIFICCETLWFLFYVDIAANIYGFITGEKEIYITL